ncbi:MAG: ACT domain-containing protein [Polyangia bacterium]
MARLPADAPIPSWATGALVSITRTPDELSIVCEDAGVPPEVRAERDFAALRVAGTIDFSVVGLLASLTWVLADAQVSVLALSTYDTDYLLVRNSDLPRARTALSLVASVVE